MRRQLGVATHLFIHDQDPISIHCLACSASEHASYLASARKAETFNEHAMRVSERTLSSIKKIRNQYWTPMKHAGTQATKNKPAQPFVFPDALDGFDDMQNDAHLFVAWTDFSRGSNPLPLEAQVFLLWYHGMYPDKLVESQRGEVEGKAITLFGHLLEMPRTAQKAALKRVAEHPRERFEQALNHPKIDPRPLILGAS